MKHLLLLLTLCCCLAAVAQQQYVVLSITGRVETADAAGTMRELALRQRLLPGSVLNIPYKGQVELLDEQHGVKHTLRAPGQASLKSMLANKQNTVLRLTANYLSYLKSHLASGGTVTARRHSDPATVTREIAQQTNDFEEQFNAFRRQAHAEYEQFRQQAIREYADFVRQAWREFGARPARPRPVIKEEPPVFIAEEDRLKPLQSVPQPVDPVRLRLPSTTPQPVPLQPIQEQKEDVAEYVDFSYYGTPLRVRFSNGGLFALARLTPDGVADVFARLASADMNNTILDCLQLRSDYQLSDWAYLLMLDSLSHACLPQANEAVLLQGYLYQQSGYKMRLGLADGRLGLLYATRHHVYDKSYFYIDGEDFYAYADGPERMSICPATYPKEQPMSLLITTTPMLAEDASAERVLQSERYTDMKLTAVVNKNLINFYNDYPTSMIDDNFLTRWGLYANKPLDPSVEATLVPALREKLSGLGKLEAVERLLNWVQTAFVYEYDDVVWGGDRAFFAEESLYYPYCDCEDRSILLSRLVRDLLHLPVVLVYYPGHLATAISFGDEQVKGDYIDLDGQHFVVCDPTFIGARVGQTMPQMDNQTAKVLLLE